MNSFPLVLALTLILSGVVTSNSSDGDYMFAAEMQAGRGIDCRACGDECIVKCGTKMFRTCCFHFSNKKKRKGLAPVDDQQNLVEHDDLLAGHDSYPDSYEMKIYPRPGP